ncbi:MAG: hypothetical protein Q9181_000396 [Wetmoreana brouardii]
MTTDVGANLIAPHSPVDTAVPLRIWLCSHPRTASNVLAKQFRGHPQLASKEYTFFKAFSYGPERPSRAVGEETRPDAEQATYQNGFNELQRFLSEIEQEGKIIFIKEHFYMLLDPRVAATTLNAQLRIPCPQVVDQNITDTAPDVDVVNRNGLALRTNPSVLPDSFMRTLAPILQIRHPAIAIPSLYRAVHQAAGSVDVNSDDFARGTTFAWERIVFDWYCEHVYTQRKQTTRGHHSWPLVVDGDDLVNENERVVSAICALANLDVKGVAVKWQPANEEIKSNQSDGVNVFLSTLHSSNGIIQTGIREGSLSIEKEAEKWVEEFGPEIANKLREVTEATMDDYKYLMQYRI